MTPTEQAAKLARELAEAIVYDKMNVGWPIRAASKMEPILTAAFADLEQRLERNQQFVRDQSAEITRLQSNLDFCQAELEERIQIMHKPKENENERPAAS